jgi:hypothetical protein
LEARVCHQKTLFLAVVKNCTDISNESPRHIDFSVNDQSCYFLSFPESSNAALGVINPKIMFCDDLLKLRTENGCPILQSRHYFYDCCLEMISVRRYCDIVGVSRIGASILSSKPL